MISRRQFLSTVCTVALFAATATRSVSISGKQKEWKILRIWTHDELIFDADQNPPFVAPQYRSFAQWRKIDEEMRAMWEKA